MTSSMSVLLLLLSSLVLAAQAPGPSCCEMKITSDPKQAGIIEITVTNVNRQLVRALQASLQYDLNIRVISDRGRRPRSDGTRRADAARRARKGEWNDLADWSLLFRILRAVELHEGVLSRAEEALRLAGEIRAAPRKQHAISAQLDAWLASSYGSTFPVVRWAAVLSTAALHARGNDIIAGKFSGNVVEALKTDDSLHVRCIAARALVELQCPEAFAILRAVLDGECHTTAAGATIGLSRLRTGEALSVLKTKTRSLLDKYAAIRDPLPTAVVGALEDMVAHARIENVSQVLRDRDLADIFMDGLNYPLPIVRGTAASALGKMEFHASWSRLKELVELSDNKDTDVRMMRASAAFACDQLCSTIDEVTIGEAAELFQRWLRNSKEIPQVRRPASSGLFKIARRGYASNAMIRDLLVGVQDQDSKIAKNCLLALANIQRPQVLGDLIVLIKKFDAHRRKIVGEVAGLAPTLTSITLLWWVLENEKRVDVLVISLFAIQAICKKALPSPPIGFPDYVRDFELFRRLAKLFVSFLGHESPLVINTSMTGLRQLVRLPPFFRTPLDSVREQIQVHARLLLSHSEPDVRATACSTLGTIGSEGDIALLERFRGIEQSVKVLNTRQEGVRFIKKRLHLSR